MVGLVEGEGVGEEVGSITTEESVDSLTAPSDWFEDSNPVSVSSSVLAGKLVSVTD